MNKMKARNVSAAPSFAAVRPPGATLIFRSMKTPYALFVHLYLQIPPPAAIHSRSLIKCIICSFLSADYLCFRAYTLVVFVAFAAPLSPLSLDRNQFAASWPSVGWRQIEHVFL
ncbi:TPA: hypothetical protein ACHIEN_001175 [Serratia marcescens]